MDAEPAPISLDELGKLIRILGLLGSEHAGERSAAALKATEWLRKAGTSWEALLIPPALPAVVVSVGGGEKGHSGAGVQPAPNHHPMHQHGTPAQQAAWVNAAFGQHGPYAASGLGGLGPVPSGPQPTWQEAAQVVLQFHASALRGSKEQDFVAGLLRKGYPNLTAKQEPWLRDICARAGVSW